MFVLDRVRTTVDWRIKLPLYHRGHLSLYPGTTVYLSSVHRIDGGLSHFPEILGTSIRQSSWSSVYRVSVALHDAPGVLHSVLESIARQGGNVLNLDSTSIDQESLHHIELVVDFASLVEPGDTGKDLSEEIEGILLADCYNYVVEEPDRGFGIRVRAHSGLRRLSSLLSKIRTNRYSSLIQEAQIDKNGFIQLGEPVIYLLSPNVPQVVAPKPPMGYFVSSDTVERVFRITLIPNERQIVWCAVRHNDRPGALSAITDQIRKNNITILSALNRIQRHQGRSWFEVILSKEEWAEVGGPSAEGSRQEEVALLLSDHDLREAYAPEPYFDRNEADSAMSAPPGDEAPPAVWVLKRQEPLRRWLAEKESILQNVTKGAPESGIEKIARASAIAALGLGIKKVRVAHGQVRPRLFLSLEFSPTNEVRIDIARSSCDSRGISLDVVKGTEEKPVVREEVLARISRATHFIGLWGPSQKDQDSRRCSPWLLWELGVASALRMPYGVLVEEGTNTLDYVAIHGERFYYSFSASDGSSFRQQFERCLDLVLGTEVPPLLAGKI